MKLPITGLAVFDVRFPTSHQLDGSDAMHPDPDYSAAYVVYLAPSQPGMSSRMRPETLAAYRCPDGSVWQ